MAIISSIVGAGPLAKGERVGIAPISLSVVLPTPYKNPMTHFLPKFCAFVELRICCLDSFCPVQCSLLFNHEQVLLQP